MKLEYLRHKNAAYFHAAEHAEELEVYYLTENVGYYTKPPEGYRECGYAWYDLVLIQFTDEAGYKRALYCPWPVVWDSPTEGGRRLRRIVQKIPVEEHRRKVVYHSPSGWVIKDEDED